VKQQHFLTALPGDKTRSPLKRIYLPVYAKPVYFATYLIPYGETRYTTDSVITDRLYTGQQQLAGLGLYNYKARFYDPLLGRFLSADTVTPGGPEGLNRYSYVNNSPVNFNDPSGHKACDEFDEDGNCSEYLAGYKKFEQEFLDKLAEVSAEGSLDCRSAFYYIVNNNVHISLEFIDRPKWSKNWLSGENKTLHMPEGQWKNNKPYIISQIVHEAKHLEQGVSLALTKNGELEAWQAGLRVQDQMDPNLESWEKDLLGLPHTKIGFLTASDLWWDHEGGIEYLTWALPPYFTVSDYSDIDFWLLFK
jgi:RHS repeat-associated protein